MDEGYRLERLTKERLPDLIYLIKDAYGRDHLLSDLEKKYDTSAWGAEYLGYIAYGRDNDPAAYYGVFPVLAEYREKKILVAQSGDTMTHSKHRRKGLFTKLAEKTYDLAKNEGIQYVFGFPNSASYPGFQKKLNWQFHEQVLAFNMFTFAIPISETLQRSGMKVKLYDNFVNFMLKKFSSESSNFGSIKKQEYSKLLRGKDYLKYKDSNNKHFVSYKSAKAWVKFDGTIAIGDISYDDSAVADIKGLLRKLRFISFITGVSRVRAYFSPETEIALQLSSVMNSKKGLHVGYRDFNSGVPIENLKFSYADFDTF